MSPAGWTTANDSRSASAPPWNSPAIPRRGPWCDLIVADAAEHARKIDARQLVPFALPPKIVRWALVVLILVSGLGFVPEYRSKNFLRKQNDQAAIKDAGRQLSELTRRTLERRPPNAEVTQKALESVGELGDKMSKVTLTRGEALKDLANVAEKLKDEMREMGKDPEFKRLEQAARASAGSGSQTRGRAPKADGRAAKTARHSDRQPTGDGKAAKRPREATAGRQGSER